MHGFKHILKSKVTTKVLPQTLRKSKFVKKTYSRSSLIVIDLANFTKDFPSCSSIAALKNSIVILFFKKKSSNNLSKISYTNNYNSDVYIKLCKEL